MIIQGDVLEVTKSFDDNIFDAMLCDPPYGLSFIDPEYCKIAKARIAYWTEQEKAKAPLFVEVSNASG